jgi:hypothetical protein
MIDFPDDAVSVLFRLGLGPWCIPLRRHDKRPQVAGWSEGGPVDEPTVREWLAAGLNLGLRTGACSGVVVIDDDRPKHGLEPFDAPPTGVSVTSPTGSKHYHYRLPEGIEARNSTSKLADKVDVRGDGGYVVVPPSIHPKEREEYRWAALGELGAWPYPAELKRERAAVAVDMSAPARSSSYGAAALQREADTVRAAVDGTRNATLTRAAYSLGQLVAGGVLDADTVRGELLSAALAVGFTEHEGARVIAASMKAGAEQPRGIPERQPVGTHTAAARRRRDVLVPGSHKLEGGEYVEQGNNVFVAQVLRELPRGTLYRRGGRVGVVRDGAFAPVDADKLRVIVDEDVRLVAWREGKGEDAAPVEIFRPCTRDLASLVLGSAAVSAELPELVEIVSAPVLLPSGEVLDTPGFDEASGVYFQPPAGVLFPKVPTTPTDAAAREACDRVLRPFAEFPMDRVGRSVLLALMLSLAARPAIAGPTPGLLVRAPEWGAGKGLLVRAAACAIAGEEPPLSSAPGGRAGDAESEWRKRITTSLLAGERVRVIDNVKDGSTLVSESLEAALTAVNWSERLLGSNDTPKLKARTVWAITGVNIQLGQALGRRCLRIDLQPMVEDSAARRFEIPDLMAHVIHEHPRLVVDALTVLRRFIALGSPKHGAAPLGSFESWDALVRGCVVWAMQTDPVVSIHSARQADPQREALGALLELWARKYSMGATAATVERDATPGSELEGLCDTLEATNDAGRVCSKLLGYKLRQFAGKRVKAQRFEKVGTRGGRAFWRVLTDGLDCPRDVVEIGGPAPHPVCAQACATDAEARGRWDGAPARNMEPDLAPASDPARAGLTTPPMRLEPV